MSLSTQHKALIKELVDVAANDLRGKLPPSARHPLGRNPYAHIYLCIKSKMGKSYKDCDDSDAEEIADIIDFLRKNPS